MTACGANTSSTVGSPADSTGGAGGGQDASAATPLPAPTKGYELYGYLEEDEVWFTLITGTNRLKTADEVKVHDEEDVDGEWVVVGVRGLGGLTGLLERVPAQLDLALRDCEGLSPLTAKQRMQAEAILSSR